jgi:hypothetical protein
MQPETKFKIKIRPFLEKLPNTWVEKIQQRSIRGTPDFILCVGGIFVALELKKSEKDKTTKLQDYKMGQIYDAGGIALKVYPENWEETHEFLVRLSKKKLTIERDLRCLS